MRARPTRDRWSAATLATLLLVPAAGMLGAGQGRSGAVAQPAPAELLALASKAGLAPPIAAWCRAGLRARAPGGFVVAAPDPGGEGRYVVLDADGAVTELAAYRGHPEVSCYSRAEARQLNDTIKKSETIHGEVSPRWDTAVACGFVDETSAVCWQYSPGSRTFVKVGGWVT